MSSFIFGISIPWISSWLDLVLVVVRTVLLGPPLCCRCSVLTDAHSIPRARDRKGAGSARNAPFCEWRAFGIGTEAPAILGALQQEMPVRRAGLTRNGPWTPYLGAVQFLAAARKSRSDFAWANACKRTSRSPGEARALLCLRARAES